MLVNSLRRCCLHAESGKTVENLPRQINAPDLRGPCYSESVCESEGALPRCQYLACFIEGSKYKNNIINGISFININFAV